MIKLWSVNAGVALSAAVVGSLVTLFLTGNLFSSVDGRVEEIGQQAVDGNELARKEAGSQDGFVAADQGDPLSAQTENYLRLQRALEDAAAERTQLAASVAQLNRQVGDLESDLINQNSLLARYENLEITGNAGSSTESISTGVAESGRQPDTQVRFNSLLAAGVEEQTALSIQSRLDQFQLERLELFDLAEREGWNETDQFSDRLEELEDQRVDLRSELGDVAYDRYLFELGRSNRVIVSSVINGSAAQNAGLRNGDVIMSYASERIFSTRDLQSATRSGQRGESVTVNYERLGQTINAEIPRGPLGVTLTMSSREPL